MMHFAYNIKMAVFITNLQGPNLQIFLKKQNIHIQFLVLVYECFILRLDITLCLELVTAIHLSK